MLSSKIRKASVFSGLLVLMFVLGIFLGGCGSSQDNGVAAQEAEKQEEAIEYPTTSIQLVVPWSAGGTSDLTARNLAVALDEFLPQPVVVSNIEGAGGAIGHTHVKDQKPDGYNILFSSVSFLGGYYTGQYPFKWQELQPLCNLTEEAVVVVVHADSPWQTLGDLIEYAKQNPNELSWAGTATGNSTHITAEGIRLASDFEYNYVPYDGGAQVRAALLGKEVDVASMTGGEAWDNVEAGNFRILVQSLPQRSVHLPDIPTIKEENIDFSFTLWKGLFVPKGTSEEIIKILNEAIAKAVDTETFKEFAEEIKVDIAYKDSDAFTQLLETEDANLEELMAEMGFKR